MNQLAILEDKDITGESAAMPDSPLIRRAVRAILFDQDGKIALLHIAGSGFYSLPGGGVDEGESLETALERELLEETGCRFTLTGEVGWIEEQRALFALIQQNYCWLAKVVGEKGTPCLTESEAAEDTRLEWHPIGEALKLVEASQTDGYRIDYITKRDIFFIKRGLEIIYG